MTFEQAVAFVLEAEGEGGAEDPRDPGGRTRWGISQRAHPDVAVARLSRDEAIRLYHERYWAPCRCAALPGPLRLPLFDGAVQHGVGQAVRLVQRALGVRADGVVGEETLRAAAAAPWGDVLVRYLALRERLYAGLPHAAVYGIGWARRLFACQRRVYEVCGTGP
jgi:lysozyme family protein